MRAPSGLPRPWPPGLRLRLAVGGAAWIAFVALEPPALFTLRYAHALLLLAPLVLVPLGLELVAAPVPGRNGRKPLGRLLGAVRVAQLPAALLLTVSVLLPRGWLAAGLALPWLFLTGGVGLIGLARLRDRGLRPLGELAIDCGLAYLVVGGAWVVADRLGLRPLEFSPAIVLLTGIHFHYAGFVLPLVTGLALRTDRGGVAGSLAGVGVIAGVPLVAVGITSTQVGLPPLPEAFAAWFLAAACVLVAWLHLRLGASAGPGRLAFPAEPRPPLLARVLWTVAALSLLFSMVLAALYGSRFYLEIPWLDIPWMRALHGTANAFGFGLGALVAWSAAGRRSPERPTSR